MTKLCKKSIGLFARCRINFWHDQHSHLKRVAFVNRAVKTAVISCRPSPSIATSQQPTRLAGKWLAYFDNLILDQWFGSHQAVNSELNAAETWKILRSWFPKVPLQSPLSVELCFKVKETVSLGIIDFKFACRLHGSASAARACSVSFLPRTSGGKQATDIDPRRLIQIRYLS